MLHRSKNVIHSMASLHFFFLFNFSIWNKKKKEKNNTINFFKIITIIIKKSNIIEYDYCFKKLMYMKVIYENWETLQYIYRSFKILN